MVRIYRAEDSEKAVRAGYEAAYVADLTFSRSLDSCGVILVDINAEEKTSPHAHEHLEEVFVAMSAISIYINDVCYELLEGDVIIVDPGENHSFETKDKRSGRILALKFPNIKDDKIVPVRGSEN
ncbi:MAG: cupin domain-containing protein [Candidatus Thorarchaeota archaeon]